MALIECPNCGSKISEQATSCPKCGQDIKDTIKTIELSKFYRTAWVLFKISVIGLLLFSVYTISINIFFSNDLNVSFLNSLTYRICEGAFYIIMTALLYISFCIISKKITQRIFLSVLIALLISLDIFLLFYPVGYLKIINDAFNLIFIALLLYLFNKSKLRLGLILYLIAQFLYLLYFIYIFGILPHSFYYYNESSQITLTIFDWTSTLLSLLWTILFISMTKSDWATLFTRKKTN